MESHDIYQYRILSVFSLEIQGSDIENSSTQYLKRPWTSLEDNLTIFMVYLRGMTSKYWSPEWLMSYKYELWKTVPYSSLQSHKFRTEVGFQVLCLPSFLICCGTLLNIWKFLFSSAKFSHLAYRKTNIIHGFSNSTRECTDMNSNSWHLELVGDK